MSGVGILQCKKIGILLPENMTEKYIPFEQRKMDLYTYKCMYVRFHESIDGT